MKKILVYPIMKENETGIYAIPDGLEKIGSDAFSYCQEMKPVIYIPDSVKEIGSFDCTE